MVISSRTPGGSPNVCTFCGSPIKIEPSGPPGDAPCPRCGHLLWFHWEDAGDAVIIRPIRSTLRSEDLDLLIDRSLNKQAARFVMDLSGVRYMSSAALAKLINLKKKLGQTQRKLELRNLHPDLLEVLRITRLDRLLDLGPSSA